MKLTIEPTSQITTLVVDGHDVPARIWEGVDEFGVPVHVFITRIAVHDSESSAVHQRFGRELSEQARARIPMVSIPLRIII